MKRAPASVAEVLRDVARALRPLRVEWYVFGAQALVVHGLPRFTADVDVTVLLGARQPGDVAAALRAGGFRLRATSPGFVEKTRVLPMLHVASRLPLDVVLGGPGLEELFASGARRMRIGRSMIPVASPLHLLVMKLIAGRPKDLEDAAALVRAKSAELDRGELDRLLDLLLEALGDDVARDRFRALPKR